MIIKISNSAANWAYSVSYFTAHRLKQQHFRCHCWLRGASRWFRMIHSDFSRTMELFKGTRSILRTLSHQPHFSLWKLNFPSSNISYHKRNVDFIKFNHSLIQFESIYSSRHSSLLLLFWLFKWHFSSPSSFLKYFCNETLTKRNKIIIGEESSSRGWRRLNQGLHWPTQIRFITEGFMVKKRSWIASFSVYK